MSPPEPMTPPECDLRGYEYMPLFGQRLFGSAFYSLALQNPRAGLAGQKLWWEAWQQCPAGSLPADDFTLCRMADFGSDVKAWAKAKEIALHGFVLCSDGRLYHHLLCKEAIIAYDKRVRDRNRKAKWRAARDEEGGSGHADVPRDTARTEHINGQGQDGGRDGDVRADRTGQDRTGLKERKEDRSLRSLPQTSFVGFDEWWERYPRKVGKDAARRAYVAAVRRGATPAALAQALALQRWNPDPQFVPHPATWLNGGRWQDEPGAAAPPPTSRNGCFEILRRLEAEESFATIEHQGEA